MNKRKNETKKVQTNENKNYLHHLHPHRSFGARDGAGMRQRLPSESVQIIENRQKDVAAPVKYLKASNEYQNRVAQCGSFNLNTKP